MHVVVKRSLLWYFKVSSDISFLGSYLSLVISYIWHLCCHIFLWVAFKFMNSVKLKINHFWNFCFILLLFVFQWTNFYFYVVTTFYLSCAFFDFRVRFWEVFFSPPATNHVSNLCGHQQGFYKSPQFWSSLLTVRVQLPRLQGPFPRDLPHFRGQSEGHFLRYPHFCQNWLQNWRFPQPSSTGLVSFQKNRALESVLVSVACLFEKIPPEEQPSGKCAYGWIWWSF